MPRNTQPSRRDEAQLRSYLKQVDTMTVSQLRDEYQELTGEPTRTRNKPWLRRKVMYLAQEQTEGGLSERAKERIQQLLGDEHARPPSRVKPPKTRRPTGATKAAPVPVKAASTTRTRDKRDPRLPPAGTVLEREYQGVQYRVRVLDTDFEFDGQRYGSLSTIAREITGTAWNGFTFWGLGTSKARKRKAG